MSAHSDAGLNAWLAWYRTMGVDDLVGEHPIDRLRAAASIRDMTSQIDETSPAPPATAAAPATRPRPASPSQPQLLRSTASLIESARATAHACADLAALAQAVAGFDGCALSETALNCCFADGSPAAELMLIGEAPGAEEDRQGKPFVGPSGQLLDKMLAAIGRDRSSVYITNCIYWRPPGNRNPTQAEIATCQPFLERQIELLRPKVILFVGGIAARGLLGVKEGVTKLRGRPLAYTTADGTEITTMVMFHPAYLLRQAAQKRLAWRDLLTVQQLLQR